MAILYIPAGRLARHPQLAQQMYRRRYDAFVQGRGWRELESAPGMERDQFDTDQAMYLLSLDPEGGIIGGLRLLPTTHPHLLSEIFPHLAGEAVPAGPDILEMTRYFTVRDRSKPAQMRRAAGELLCAMFEVCLQCDVRWITMAFDTFYLRRMRQNNWGETILGDPARYSDGTAVAIRVPVSIENLMRTRETHAIESAVVNFADMLEGRRDLRHPRRPEYADAGPLPARRQAG
jgi:acyl-homoserine lactone synthase